MNVTLTDEGYTLDGKWRLAPSEYMESLTLPNPPAELAISAQPAAMVDAGDDGYFAEILPDVSVSVGDQLYAFPPLNVDRELWIESFNQWWEAHGQYLRAGGGQYEKTFGYHAWEAAAALYAAPTPPQSLSTWQPMRTAPRDGTRIVVLGNNYGDKKQGTHICIALCIDGLFYHENDDIEMNVDSGFFLEYLTHWMPLPEYAP